MAKKSKIEVVIEEDSPSEVDNPDQPKVERFFDEENKLHRDDDLPAVIVENGPKYWLQHGVQHRENGPAVIHPDGSTEYWVEGKKHRLDGPAVESPNGKFWIVEGMRHRMDGPAVELSDGSIEWWVADDKITDLVNDWLIKMRLSHPLTERGKWLFNRDFG